MLDLALHAIFVIFFWWFSTGVVLYIGQRPHRERLGWIISTGGLALCALISLPFSSASETTVSVYAAFIAAIVIWGFHELCFLYGYVTGPNTKPCPPNLNEYQRFWAALGTVLYHELALLVTVIAVFALTIGEPNATAIVTFAILWLMRISAKLNLFAGTPQPALDMMPVHLEYLASYFKLAKVGVTFILTMSLSLVALGFMVLISQSHTMEYQHVAFTLTTTLLVLALLEHCFFILPVNETRLWAAWFKDPHPFREKFFRKKATADGK